MNPTAQPATAARPLLLPINETGEICRGYLRASYEQVLAVLGPDNVTHLDDDQKVGASWGFSDQSGRRAFVWAFNCRRFALASCAAWSIDGSWALLEELFPGQLEW